MWVLDFPDNDPVSNYAEPTTKQLIYAQTARAKLAQLKELLERLTIPQQRAIIGEIAGGVYRKDIPAARTGIGFAPRKAERSEKSD